MKIDVITPIFNQWHYLDRCRNSVVDQLLPGDEHLFFDDGSKLLNPQIKRRSDARRGVSFARNRLIEESGAEWIKFLDADDMLAPFALNHLRELEADGALVNSVLLCGVQIKVVDGVVRGSGSGNLMAIERRNPFLPSMVFVRRHALMEVGMFDERIEFEEDWDLWLRLWQRFGSGAMMMSGYPVCYYWIDQAERAEKFRPNHEIEGVDVREYLRRKYGIDPLR